MHRWLLRVTVCITLLLASTSLAFAGWWSDKDKDKEETGEEAALLYDDTAATFTPTTQALLRDYVVSESYESEGKVAQVSEDVERLIEVHHRLATSYQSALRDIERARTQAQIHQDILQTIRAQSSTPPTLAQAIINQQKVRLIAEEARKNAEEAKRLHDTLKQLQV